MSVYTQKVSGAIENNYKIFNPPHQYLAKKKIDKCVFILLVFLAMLPFENIFLLPLGFITLDLFEIIYFLIIGILILKLLLFGFAKRGKPYLLVIFAFMLLLYVILSVIVYQIELIYILRQIRFYAPFMIALLLLATDTCLTIDRFLKQLIVASLVGALLSLYIHYISPDIIEKSFTSQELISIINVHGRLYWINAHLTFFVLLSFFVIPKRTRFMNFLIFLTLLITIITMFNTLNRTMLIGFIIYSVGLIFKEHRILLISKRLMLMAILFVVGIISISVLIEYDERVRNLFELRYLGRGNLDKVYENAVIKGRYNIYIQYVESFKKYFPIGQGFGRPFSTILYPVYTTDISLMGFLLPFGISGVIFFILFVISLIKTVKKSTIRNDVKKSIYLMIFISILMSFNIDLYSRNTFVIFLTMLILSLKNGYQLSRNYLKRNVSSKN